MTHPHPDEDLERIPSKPPSASKLCDIALRVPEFVFKSWLRGPLLHVGWLRNVVLMLSPLLGRWHLLVVRSGAAMRGLSYRGGTRVNYTG